ncbi:zf-HC2 domain-containing protein [candidate division KSB1 bacterium]|nr:zf-HC2 domain-containing protein [candidate division KSB1 bacterium]
MKNCDHYTTLFSDYIDGDLDDRARSSLRAHLAACPACAQRLNAMQAVRGSLAQLPHIKTSESFDLLLQARLRREMRQAPRRRPFPLFELNWRVPAYAAAALCLVFFGALLQRRSYSSFIAKSSDSVAMDTVRRTDLAAIEPGYLVFVELDTVNNLYRIINYGGIDNVNSLQDFRRALAQQDDNRTRTGLPNLRTAPQNRSVTMRTRQDMPQLRQAEFIF